MVSGYTIEGILGQGGMGTVYRARNPSLPRSDALKVLSTELSADPHFRARFEREAELAATLNHPNIVTVYARGESEGQLWIAMQYVAGSDADQELRANRMTADRAVHIVTEVAKALDYAHRRHLLHRDVKPANFLLDHDDERVFLADFGIARALDEAVHLTQTGSVMASVAYAAPESLNAGPVDGRADIYSLGCSLYRLLTQQAPYSKSGGMAAMAAAHLSAPPPRVTDVVPALPRAIDDVVARAMAKNPGDRFQTARELANAAARALGDVTTQIRAAPTSSLTAPWQSGPIPPPAWPPPSHSGPVGPRGAPTGPHFGPSEAAHPAAQQPWGAPPLKPAWRPAAAQKWWRRPRWIAAAAVLVLAIAAAAVGGVVLSGGDTAPTYQAQTVTHTRGATEIAAEPKSVVALGPGDTQAVLALGVQPVAVLAPGGVLPSWEQSLITGDPRIMSELDTGVISAVRPDLIIDTAEVDVATYNKLALIAPTVTRPQGSSSWTWQDQLLWIGRILGRTDQADQLLDEAEAQQSDIRSRHPGFEGKTIQIVNVDDDAISVALADSPAANYLSGIGFEYSDALARTSDDSGDTRAVPDPAQLNAAAPDVRVVLRTDSASGGGSYNGLPKPFSEYRGATVIIDDPRVITALDSGGFAATEYLNSTLVDSLSRHVR